jgi:hypothetical protein
MVARVPTCCQLFVVTLSHGAGIGGTPPPALARSARCAASPQRGARRPARPRRGGPCQSLWMVARWAPLYLDTRRQVDAGYRPLGRCPVDGTLPPRTPDRTRRWRSGARPRCGGRAPRELSGGNRMAGHALERSSRDAPVGGLAPPASELLCPPCAGCRRGLAALRIATWLILPVVICLSQRLSHACLSISNLYGETANGSLNQLSFI